MKRQTSRTLPRGSVSLRERAELQALFDDLSKSVSKLVATWARIDRRQRAKELKQKATR